MKYSLCLLPSAEKDCNRLSRESYNRCRKAMIKLEENPRSSGSQKLVGEDGYRIRVGDYRILYRIDDEGRRVFVYRVKHRRDAYR